MTDKTIAFSLLDLAPIPEGSSAREAFSHSLDLARRLKAAIIALAGRTPQYDWHCQCCHVGIDRLSGGEYHHAASGVWRRDVANHSPLVIAEQFGTLNTLYPGRIDLGLVVR